MIESLIIGSIFLNLSANPDTSKLESSLYNDSEEILISHHTKKYKAKDVDYPERPRYSIRRSRLKSRLKRGNIGLASWYGRAWHGRHTASSEKFNMYALTAAHNSLPFGTKVRVTNLNNGRSVVVRINDRGGFNSDHKRIRQLTRNRREIDLSYAAAEKIGMIQQGIAKVRIEVLR